jgi:transposase-like protein
VQRRRRYSAAEKQRFVEQTLQPGMKVSLVAREHRLAPSLLFRWRKLASEGAVQAVGAEEAVVPASEVKALQQQVREPQRLLGKKTPEHEILKEAAEVCPGKKVVCALLVIEAGRHPVATVCRVLGVSRSHIAQRRARGAHRRERRGRPGLEDPVVLSQLREPASQRIG